MSAIFRFVVTAGYGNRDLSMRRIVLVLALLCAACGSSTPTTPTPPPSPPQTGFAGTWAGSITHPDGSTGSLTLTLALNLANTLSGTWQTQFANPTYTRSGQAQSTTVGTSNATIGISDNAFVTSPVTSPPGCLFDRTVILVLTLESNELKGDALFGVCATGATVGSVSLRRQ